MCNINTKNVVHRNNQLLKLSLLLQMPAKWEAPIRCNQRKPPQSNKGPAQLKINIFKKKSKRLILKRKKNVIIEFWGPSPDALLSQNRSRAGLPHRLHHCSILLPQVPLSCVSRRRNGIHEKCPQVTLEPGFRMHEGKEPLSGSRESTCVGFGWLTLAN